jgi:hypothetical protein
MAQTSCRDRDRRWTRPRLALAAAVSFVAVGAQTPQPALKER